MTDRIHSITLALGEDMRVDDAEALIAAARMLKGVIDVRPNVSDTSSFIAETRVRRELGEKLLAIIYPRVGSSSTGGGDERR